MPKYNVDNIDEPTATYGKYGNHITTTTYSKRKATYRKTEITNNKTFMKITILWNIRATHQKHTQHNTDAYIAELREVARELVNVLVRSVADQPRLHNDTTCKNKMNKRTRGCARQSKKTDSKQHSQTNESRDYGTDTRKQEHNKRTRYPGNDEHEKTKSK